MGAAPGGWWAGETRIDKDEDLINPQSHPNTQPPLFKTTLSKRNPNIMVDVTILDGGFSTQLQNYVDDTIDGDPLWTAKYLKLQPNKCALVHRDFVMAGAEVISTGSYQSSIEGYKRYLGVTDQEALGLIRDSVKLARDGIRMAERETGKSYREVKVAGSVGPYGAFLHDGSEYTGTYCSDVTRERLISWHRPRIEALVSAGADLLAIETIPCLREALAVLTVLRDFPRVKAWLSFSIRDICTLASGENFETAVVRCWEESNNLIAIGANCFHPSLVTPLFTPIIARQPQIPAIVYPNNGEKYDVSQGKWLNMEVSVNIEDYVHEWLELGISYIGGCCRTDSKDISRMRHVVDQWRIKKSS